MSRTAGRTAGTLSAVAVVDYGLGNLRSVTRGLERAGAAVEITDDPTDFKSADGIVLPGVGAFREGVENAGPYRDALLDAAERDQPLFGICLGMQMLLSSSEEAERAGQGEVRGLDLIPGTNVRFSGDLTVPHMGWNELAVQRAHPLVAGVDPRSTESPSGQQSRERRERDGGTAEPTRNPRSGVDGGYAYFVHSYYAVPDDDAAVVATTDYGEPFPSVVANEAGTVFGTQFHPEKSGETGLAILRNFVEYCAEA